MLRNALNFYVNIQGHKAFFMLKNKLSLVFLLSLFAFVPAMAQPYTLTVNNGYGSGSYNAGDTVHIWAKEFPANSIYDKWTGDTSFLAMPDEWHTTLVMPAQNINLTANFTAIPPYNITLDTIQGKNIPKPVYYYFPANCSGVIYFFHGTGGSAKNWMQDIEKRQMVNQAAGEGFGIIITEADEATLQTDLNGDGKIRWTALPLDSVSNYDYANTKIITDTLINRGLMAGNLKRFAVGMSDGGYFTSSCSFLFNYDAGISYCEQGMSNLFSTSTVPIQFCMQQYDNQPEVGAVGDSLALANANLLNSRGVCSRYYLHGHSPVYPQRFMRIPGIILAKSQNIFQDLVNNNFLDGNNFLLVLPDTIQAHYAANPSAFPGLNAILPIQRAYVISELNDGYACHTFTSDYNALSLKFLKNPCAETLSVINVSSMADNMFSIYPNPAQGHFTVELLSRSLPNFNVTVYDINGRKMLEQDKVMRKADINCSAFTKGIYCVHINSGKEFVINRLIVVR